MSAQFLQLTIPDWNWSPHQYLVCVPPRAAYSHSASLGSRYAFRVAPASQATNCLASLQLTLAIGASSLPGGGIRNHAVDLHRIGDILDFAISERLISANQFVLHLLVNAARDVNLARIGNAL